MNKYNTSSRTIHFYQSPTKFFKANWPALLLIFPVLMYRRSQNRVVKVLLILTAGPLLLFVYPCIPALYRFLFRIPVVEINEQAISYMPGPIWFINLDVSMRWEEVAALYVNELTIRRKKYPQKRSRTVRFLAVLPKDQETFFQREKILSLRRFPLLALIAATKTPLMLFEQATAPTSSQDVLALISSRYQDKIQENGIEVREEQKTLYESK